ncbi:ferredoxin [Longibacter salinarum]|uniref:Ferredoxin n=1 Tax=Longibacter salinarum TaxID=1850348 RepID=A0A2A8CUT1_9BACT|nr:2Fe-2S iron-sulfur cluster-binding protein [Longibacter salinarum]PEN12217.1 ferredoxin [Longibacter salinarum]
MAAYRIDIRNRGRRVVEVSDDEPLLDALEEAGLRLPYGCRHGACITCAARLLDGAVDQSDGTALKPRHREAGYVLLCIARPRSDCVIEVGAACQKDLFNNPFKHES